MAERLTHYQTRPHFCGQTQIDAPNFIRRGGLGHLVLPSGPICESVHPRGGHNREARQIHLPRSKISAAGRPVTCEPAATAYQRDLTEGAGLAS